MLVKAISQKWVRKLRFYVIILEGQFSHFLFRHIVRDLMGPNNRNIHRVRQQKYISLAVSFVDSGCFVFLGYKVNNKQTHTVEYSCFWSMKI